MRSAVMFFSLLSVLKILLQVAQKISEELGI
jgi:hypothetical protein